MNHATSTKNKIHEMLTR